MHGKSKLKKIHRFFKTHNQNQQIFGINLNQ